MRASLAAAMLLALLPGRTFGQEEAQNMLNCSMKALSGEEVNLAEKYDGKVLLVVNVASRCGFTPQYKQLQALHEAYAEQGLAVLGFPCNQFGGQEPGTAEEIQDFCSTKYDVSFDMFDKIDVNGDNAAELYHRLTSLDTQPTGKGDVRWNFEKFLISKDGNVVARFPSNTKPDAEEVVAAIKAELAVP